MLMDKAEHRAAVSPGAMVKATRMSVRARLPWLMHGVVREIRRVRRKVDAEWSVNPGGDRESGAKGSVGKYTKQDSCSLEFVIQDSTA